MQFFRRKRYRFFYPAGLISLVLLPLLGYFYIYSKPVFEQKYVKEVNYLNPKWLAQVYSMPDPRSFRTYQKIELTGAQSDKEKLNSTQFAIRQMLAEKDTINGIQIIFTQKAKYWSIVRGLDICQIENARTYFFYENNLWVFYLNPQILEAREVLMPCGGVQLLTYEPEEFFKKPKLDISQTAKSFWPSIILYIIMVSLTAQKVVREVRKPTIKPFNNSTI